MTGTYATFLVSRATWSELHGALSRAGYAQQLHADGTIVLDGLAVEPVHPKESGEDDPVLTWEELRHDGVTDLGALTAAGDELARLAHLMSRRLNQLEDTSAADDLIGKQRKELEVLRPALYQMWKRVCDGGLLSGLEVQESLKESGVLVSVPATDTERITIGEDEVYVVYWSQRARDHYLGRE